MRMPSRHRASISAAVLVGFMPMVTALRTARALCLSRSGAKPLMARAPSKITEPSQKAWSIGPRILGSSVNQVPLYQ